MDSLKISKEEIEEAGFGGDGDPHDENYDGMFLNPDEHSPRLLTYAAQQQIKHLYELNPSEWTPEKLAESFPINIIDLKKVLRNNFRLDSTSEIQNYDRKVEENWKLFLSGRLNVKPNAKTLNNRLNYKGNSLLPVPMNENKKKVERPLFFGTFSRILNPDLPKIETRSVKKTQTEPSDKSRVLDEEDMNAATTYNQKRIPGKTMTADEFEKKNIQSKHKSKYDIEYKEWMKNVESINQKAGKTVSDQKFIAEDKSFEPIRKYEKDTFKLTIDTPKNGNKGREAYSYDEHHGYQKPLGQPVDLSEIKTPHHLRGMDVMYRKKDSFYDNEGNFFYSAEEPKTFHLVFQHIVSEGVQSCPKVRFRQPRLK
ncbi:hypothetical protein GQR58_017626 [Nymphon striatum]|nr:hypothetical protein GQR58_017626 [Nymphon striatum]